MASTVNTQSLNELITQFRQITAKDAITPESLGYILKRISDLLATAGTTEETSVIQTWYEKMKSAPAYISDISNALPDPEYIWLNQTRISPTTGNTTITKSTKVIPASQSRAGAMTAQHVKDLMEAIENVTKLKKDTTALQLAVSLLRSQLGLSDGAKLSNVYNTSQISVRVVDGRLSIFGAQPLLSAGYVPYLFRHTRKRNPFHDRYSKSKRKYCCKTKGWHLFGSRYAVKISGNYVLFSTNEHGKLHQPSRSYTSEPSKLVYCHIKRNGHRAVGWGRRCIDMRDYRGDMKNERMIRLRFGLGFAKPINPGWVPITPANLVSPLVEFSIVYDPNSKKWYYSK